MKTRWGMFGALLIVAALVLGACGGGDDEGDGGDEGSTGATAETGTETGTEGGEEAAFTVNAKEFVFDPATLDVPADEEVTVTVVNGGAVEHDFTLDEASVKIATPATESVSGTFTLPAGTYTFYCSVPGHREAGMEGTITAS